MLTPPRIATATVRGYDHLSSGSQDAVQRYVSDDLVLGVICDGCGQEPHSEVGAQLGARLLIGSLARHLPAGLFARTEGEGLATMEHTLAAVQQDVLYHLGDFAGRTGQRRSQVIREMFLFTALAVVMTEHMTYLIAVGDGYMALNGDLRQLGPFPNNEPPYLAYGGLIGSKFPSDSEQTHLHVRAALPTAQVRSAFIACDGFADVILAHEQQRPIPGLRKTAPAPETFWSDPQLWANPDWAHRQLNLMNGRDELPGALLHDDTTIFALQRDEVTDEGGTA